VDHRLHRWRLTRRISCSILCWVLYLVVDYLLGMRGRLEEEEEEGWGILRDGVGIRRLGANNMVVFLVLLGFLVGLLEVAINTVNITMNINTVNLATNSAMNAMNSALNSAMNALSIVMNAMNIAMVVVGMNPNMYLLRQYQPCSL